MRYLLVVSWILCCVGFAQAGDVVLTEGEHSLKATIDGDVFTVYRHGADLPKPYFLPVTAAGAWEMLEKAELGDEHVAGRTAFVCDETLTVQQGGAAQKLPFGTVVQVNEVGDTRIQILESDSMVPRSALAPLAGTVTRLVNLNPPAEKERNSPLYYDHPHHKGVWFSVDEVNGVKFWKEDGRIVSQSVEVVQAQGNPAVFKTVNHWLNLEGVPLVKQTTVFSLYADRLIGCDVTLAAVEQPVTFEDTKEGMFAIRLPNSMREFISQGPVTNAEGTTGSAACWGRESDWIDYLGKVDENVLGVTMMDHSGNPRRSRYHVRDYGLFAVNPFGAHAYSNGEQPAQPLKLEPGAAGVRFRYGLFVHSGVLPASDLAARYAKFVEDEK